MRGKLIVPFSFDYAEKFSDGLAQVWDDSIKYLDTSGKVVIALDYDPNTTAGDFHEGMAPSSRIPFRKRLPNEVH